MAYSVGVERRAQKQIARLMPAMRDRVESALRSLADEPRPHGSRELQGREGRRLRVGDYCVVYVVDEERNEVTVLRIAHRRDVYRRG